MSDSIDPSFVKEGEAEAPVEGEAKEERPVENLKAEMDRKLNSYEEKLDASNKLIQEMNKRNEELLLSLQDQQRNTENQQPDEYIDPYSPEYKERIKNEVKAEVLEASAAQNANQVQISSILNDAAAKYPELNDTKTDLRKAADGFYDSLPKHLQGTPEGIELAISRAITKVQPKPKKETASDDFMLGGETGSGRAYKAEFKDDDHLFAKRVGLNLDDPKVAEKVKNKKKQYAATRGGR